MAREGLRRELTTALHRAVTQQGASALPGLRVKTNGDSITVNLTVQPVASGVDGAVRPDTVPGHSGGGVASRRRPTWRRTRGLPRHRGVTGRIAALEQELRAKEEYLQTTIEELETSNEELKSTNEEMQSVNEELQSTNEELETSKEELQSVNEELATVNAELQTKVADLSRANNDMNNLLAGTGIGTLFVDQQLRIPRFTPAATQVINLIQTDVGRPVGHIVSNLVGYDRLVEDVQSRAGHPDAPRDGSADHDGRVVPAAHPALSHAGKRDRGRGDHLRRHHRRSSGWRRPCAKRESLPRHCDHGARAVGRAG